MKRPKINNYPIMKDGKHRYYHDDLQKYIDYLEAKQVDYDKGYYDGYTEAQTQACTEISNNYTPKQ